MTKKQKITIHKKNEIVRGTDTYSLNAKKALNAIYWGMQKGNLYEYEYITIKFSDLRKIMNLNNVEDYVQRIKEAMQELREPLELNNFYHPLQKMKFDWYSLSFLDEVGFIKDKNNVNTIARFRVNPLMKHLMQLEGNFTKLELIHISNKFRTKYAMKLYEYLKSFDGYKYLDISQSHLMKLLNLDENSKYRYMSDLTILLNRQIKELKNKSDLAELKVIPMKRDKFFRIIINPKSKKMVDKIEAKSALENLIKRF